MSNYLIVGAGLAGATLARLLTDYGDTVTIIDKRDHIAGNCYTYKEKGITIHKYGAHIFHTNNEDVWNFVNKFAKFNNFINSPLASYNDILYNLPFNMNTFYKIFNEKWPDKIKKIIDKEIEDYKKEHPTIENLEDQAINMVGTTVYNILIKGYTEKQWGKKCSELSPEIIKRLPLRMTYDNNYFNDKYQGIPIDGYTEMISNMIYDIPVILNTDFNGLKSEYEKDYDYIIYTGKIDEYFNYIYGNLEYRSLKFINKEVNCSNYQGNAVINYTNSNIPYTRVIEHKHFNNDISDVSIITFEYPSFSGESYYPMSDDKNLKLYNKYKDLANKQNKVIFAGRLGKYKYFDMDDVIEDCFILFESLKEKHIKN